MSRGEEIEAKCTGTGRAAGRSLAQVVRPEDEELPGLNTLLAGDRRIPPYLSPSHFGTDLAPLLKLISGLGNFSIGWGNTASPLTQI